MLHYFQMPLLVWYYFWLKICMFILYQLFDYQFKTPTEAALFSFKCFLLVFLLPKMTSGYRGNVLMTMGRSGLPTVLWGLPGFTRCFLTYGVRMA